MFRPIDALNALCSQLTRDLFPIAKFLFVIFAVLDLDVSHAINLCINCSFFYIYNWYSSVPVASLG